MSKIAKFYENLQKSFRPKNTKKAAKKATSVFLASLLTITYISSSRFNENVQIEAAAKWLGGIEVETPSNLIATLEGEYNPKNPQKYIQLNNSDYSVAYKPGSPEKSLTDENGNITLPPGAYKCKNFKISQTARFRIQDPKKDSEKQEITLWLEGDNEFIGVNGSSRASDAMTTQAVKQGDKTIYTKYGGGSAGGTAGIYLPSNTTLYIRGNGGIKASGGNGAQGLNAQNGCFIDLYKKYNIRDSDYDSTDYRLTTVSTLLKNDMSKTIYGSSAGTIERLNDEAGTGAGGSGGGGGGSAIGTDGTDGGKGGKGFETYNDLNAACGWDLTSWLTRTGSGSSAHDTHIEINNTDGDGASSKASKDAGTVYFLNKGKAELSAGQGGGGGKAGQGMPNRKVTNKYRILGGGYGDYSSGRNNEDYDYHYLERLGGLRLLLGGGGGSGGGGSDGKKIGPGGAGGGGGGAGGLSAAQYHLGLAENDGENDSIYNPITKVKEICSNKGINPNEMYYPYCGYAYGNSNREYGHYYGPLIYHFNVGGDDAKAYYPFACNGGGGGGGGGGNGVGGGGSGGYINYISRRQNFSSIIPQSDYLNRATHSSAYWTWRSDHYKDFAPNWGMGGNPYSPSPSYRTADSPYVTTTDISDYRVVRFRIRNSEDTTNPLKYLKSTDSKSSATTYDEKTQYSATNPTKYYIRNEERTYYDGYYEPTAGKVCQITNDSGKDGGNAVLRYRTYVNGDNADKQCSCFCNKTENGTTDAYPIYPTAWGGQAGLNGDATDGGLGGSAKNVATYNKYYYNQEWKQWNDGHGMHDKGPGSRHQDKQDSKDPVGVGCSAEGFSGNKGGNKSSEGGAAKVYYSESSGYSKNEGKEGTNLLDASIITLEMYMTNNNFMAHTNQGTENISWKIDNNKEIKSLSQIPFDESYFGKEIALSYTPRRKVTNDDGSTTDEKYEKDNVFFGNLSQTEENLGKFIFETENGKEVLDSITVKYTFNFKLAECDWSQTNDLLAKKEDNATDESKENTYPYYEAKYTSIKTIPTLDVSYGDTKLVEGKHYDLRFYLAKTEYNADNTSSWAKVNPLGQTGEIQPIAATTENEQTKEITTAGSLLENMPQYSKMTTLSTEVADRIVVELVPKYGFTPNEINNPQVLFTYSIVQANLSEDNISINLKPKTIEYDGQDHNTPEAREKFSIGVYVRDVFRNLNKDEFDITWPIDQTTKEDQKCINVGDYGIVIVPKSSTGFKGAATAVFTIIPYDIGAEKTAYKLELDKTEFDFSEEKSSKPAVKVLRNDGVSQNDDPLKLTDDDYIVEYHDAEQNDDGSYKELSESAGKKVVVVKGKNPYSYDKEGTENLNCNFTGMLTATYNVNGTDINNGEINVSINPESFTFNGNEQKPEVIVTKVKNGVNTSLAEGEDGDYTVSWPEENYKNAGTKKLIVKGNGKKGYTGEKEMTYKIDPIEYDPESSDWEMTITPDSFYYNGTKLVPKVSVKHKETTLEENTDYTLEYSDDSIDAGEKIITVNLKGNYTGKKELSYKIYNISYDTNYGDGLDTSLYDIISKDYDTSNADLKVEKIVSSEETDGTDLTKYIYIEKGNLKVIPSTPASKYVVSIKNNITRNSIPPFYVNLSVAKAIPELSIKDKTAVYTTKGITIDDITLKFKNNENFGEIKDLVNFDYYTDKECTSLVKDTPVNVGTYYVKAYVKAPSANYENVTSNVATLTIQKSTQNLTGSKSYSGYPGSWIQIDTKTDANTKLTYKSSDDSIVQVDSEGKMLLMKDGTTTVTTTAEGTGNYESATFEATVVVDKTLNKITAGDKTITDTIENNNSGNNGGTSGGSNNNSSSNSGGNSSGSSSSSSENNSSQNNSSSQGNGSSNSEQTQEEEKKSGLPLVADKFWSTILTTGDKSIYIISIAMVSIAIALTILIVLKRKDKDE